MALTFDDLPDVATAAPAQATPVISFDDLPDIGGASVATEAASEPAPVPSSTLEVPPDFSEQMQREGLRDYLESAPKAARRQMPVSTIDPGATEYAPKSFEGVGLAPEPRMEKAASQGPITDLLPRPEGKGIVPSLVRGTENVVEGLATPSNAALLVGLAGAPAAIHRLAATVFAAHGKAGISEEGTAMVRAVAAGDYGTAAEHLPGTLMSAAMIGAGATQMKGRTSVPKEDVPAIISNLPSQVLRHAVDDPKIAAKMPEGTRGFALKELRKRATTPSDADAPSISTPSAEKGQGATAESTAEPPPPAPRVAAVLQTADALRSAASAAQETAPASAQAARAYADALTAKASETPSPPAKPAPAVEATPAPPDSSQVAPSAKATEPAPASKPDDMAELTARLDELEALVTKTSPDSESASASAAKPSETGASESTKVTETVDGKLGGSEVVSHGKGDSPESTQAETVSAIQSAATVKPPDIAEPTVKVRDYDAKGRLTAEADMPLELARKKFKAHESIFSKLLDCLGK